MRWECVECGAHLTSQEKPTVCPLCGIGGSLFVRPGRDPEDGTLDGSFREAWLDYGMTWSADAANEALGFERGIGF
mgnify:CR=1 FL=1